MTAQSVSTLLSQLVAEARNAEQDYIVVADDVFDEYKGSVKTLTYSGPPLPRPTHENLMFKELHVYPERANYRDRTTQ